MKLNSSIRKTAHTKLGVTTPSSAKEPSDIVDRGVAVARGDDAERHAHQYHDQPGCENELKRCREGIDQIQ